MLVQCDEEHLRHLVLKIVDLQEKSLRLLVYCVGILSEEDRRLRDLIGMIGSTFQDDVDFAWEGLERQSDMKAEVYNGSDCRGGRRETRRSFSGCGLILETKNNTNSGAISNLS
jgi:hypothetical protein